MSAARTPEVKCRRTCRAVALACLIVISAIWTATYERIKFERADIAHDAARQNAALALAFEEHTVGTLRSIDQALRVIEHEYRRSGRPSDLVRLVEEGRIDLGPVSFFGIVDARGMLVAGTVAFQPVSVADREYFTHHRENAGAALRVGRPALGRVSGKLEIPVSRRISNPDGSFAGVALAGIEPDYFARFYRDMGIARDGVVQLVGLDGIVRARRTDSAASAGQDIAGSSLLEHAAGADSGSFVSKGRLDGIQRYQSFRVLREPGLVVAVGASEKAVLAEARGRALMYLAGSAAATLFVLLSCVALTLAMLRQRRATEAALAGEERYRATFEQTAVGIVHAALDGRFIKVNAKLCRLLGYEEQELLARNFREVTHPADLAVSDERAGRLLASGEANFAPEYEKRYLRKDGSPVWVSILVSLVRDAQGKPDYFIAMVQDIGARKEAQAKLDHSAHHDPLTDLPNRVLLADRLTQALNQARRKGWKAAVLSVNLDRFKAVNNALGHENGDRLLREAAARLRASVRSGDTVAHIGGDEFVVVAAEIAAAEDAGRVAQKVIEAVSAPYRLDEHEVVVTASVGVALHPADGTDGETLIKNAAAAMLRAKQTGRNSCQFYAATMNARASETLLLEADLRYALRRDEFILHFQPRASIADGSVRAFEALLRWQRPGKGLVSPAEFIPLLETSGMIVAAGEWVIRAACAQIRTWQRSGFAPAAVAVNVSAQQFLGSDLYSVIDAALLEHGIDASLLEIEITESDAMRDPERAVEVLRRIRERGVRVAIDDFGTGYSSLSYLKRFPIDFLKLDRSFVTGLPNDADDVSIARAVIGLAHSLGLHVIAEGVETEAQRAFLARNGCDELQGYLFSRPVPAAECAAFLQRAPEANRRRAAGGPSAA